MLMSFVMAHRVVGVRASVAFLIAMGLVVPGARAGVMPPDYGFQWCTVGDPGNRLPNSAESGWGSTQYPYGSVDHSYRLTKTEVTNAQYIEFVRAYLVFHPGVTNLTGISGFDIEVWGGSAQHNNGNPNFSANMSWEYAARFCNWLHNGKAMTADAFEQGVYDTSTFYRDQNGVAHHNATPAPGAKFWIPTLDEWIKAAYWDPAKNNGAGGYWMYPGMSDVPLVPGIPGITPGAQTSTGTWVEPPVGYFPDVRSPWGLLDTSGGVAEFTSSVDYGPQGPGFGIGGTSSYDRTSIDRLRYAFGGDAIWNLSSDGYGLRLASVVPSAGILGMFPICGVFLFSRRRP
jgi:hypothetical protein